MIRLIRKFFGKQPDPFSPSKVVRGGHDILMTDTHVDHDNPEYSNVFWRNK